MPTDEKLKELVRRIDEAVRIQEQHGCCMAVKDALEEIVRSGEDLLSPEYLVPTVGRYARRLVHRDPENKYTVLAMVWDKGQGTPLHDHDHRWCVECVYRGRILVTSFSLIGEADSGDARFVEEQQVMAGMGEAGALIPPFEYHTITNPDQTPTITIHVYEGEMDHCYAFFPNDDGSYRRERRELCYSV